MLLAVLASGTIHGALGTSSPIGAPFRGGLPVAARSAVQSSVRTPPDSTRAERIRARLDRRISRVFPSEGGMVSALLLAERGGVEREVRDAFRRSGTSHLLAISGFHVGVIAGWLVLLLRLARLHRRRALALASLLIWGYVALLGFPGSASRAALIFTLVCLGRLLGRPVMGLAAWGSALLLVAVVAPARTLEVGTRLSFLGALGLIVWAPGWTRTLKNAGSRAADRAGIALRPSRLDGVAGAVAASAAAQWATIGLAAWSFQQVALMGLPATLVATPLVSIALPGALLSLALDLLRIPGAVVMAAGTEAALAGLRVVVQEASSIGPVIRLTPATVLGGVGAALMARRVWRRLRRGPAPALLVPAIVLSTVLLTTPLVDHFGVRGTEIHFVDVGQGDAIAIRSGEGRWVLIDTGPPSGDRLVRELLRIGVARIDLLVLSHPDLDHIGGAAAVVDAFPVGVILDPVTVKGGAWRELLLTADHRGVPWRSGEAGQSFRVDELRFDVLAPGADVQGTGADASANDRSLVLRMRFGDFDAVFTGDIPIAVEEAIAEVTGDVELLKVAHHGSRTSTGAGYLAAVRPEIAVIQVGRRNRFGHPVPEVLRRLRDHGAQILRTDLHGTVTIFPSPDGSWHARTALGDADGAD